MFRIEKAGLKVTEHKEIFVKGEGLQVLFQSKLVNIKEDTAVNGIVWSKNKEKWIKLWNEKSFTEDQLFYFLPRVEKYFADDDGMQNKLDEEIEEFVNFRDVDNLKEELCDIAQVCATTMHRDKMYNNNVYCLRKEVCSSTSIQELEQLLFFTSHAKHFDFINKCQTILVICYNLLLCYSVEERITMLQKHKNKIERRNR